MKKKTIEELLTIAGYSTKVINYYMNKVNVGVIEHPDVGLTYVGPICGDSLTLFLKIEKEVIIDAKFEYLGCVGTASSGSAVVNLVLGKTIDEASKITKDDIIAHLNGLPETHCADFAVTTLMKALEKLKEKQSERNQIYCEADE